MIIYAKKRGGVTSSRLHSKRLSQLEVNDRLRRNIDIPISRQTRSRRSSSSACQAADQQPRSASRNTANQHSESAAAADERRRPLTLALL